MRHLRVVSTFLFICRFRLGPSKSRALVRRPPDIVVHATSTIFAIWGGPPRGQKSIHWPRFRTTVDPAPCSADAAVDRTWSAPAGFRTPPVVSPRGSTSRLRREMSTRHSPRSMGTLPNQTDATQTKAYRRFRSTPGSGRCYRGSEWFQHLLSSCGWFWNPRSHRSGVLPPPRCAFRGWQRLLFVTRS